MKSKALTVKKKVYKDAYRKVLMYFKCKEKETKTVKIVFYTKEGELIDQFDSPYSDYDAIIPDSVMEDVIKTVEFLFD